LTPFWTFLGVDPARPSSIRPDPTRLDSTKLDPARPTRLDRPGSTGLAGWPGWLAGWLESTVLKIGRGSSATKNRPPYPRPPFFSPRLARGE